MKIVIGVIALLFVVALVLFPEFRKKLMVLIGGGLNVFVEDTAKTPEGANAVFSQAIEEAQDKYNRAANTLNKLSGELKAAESAIERLKKEIQIAEANCENLVRSNNMAEAEVYATRRHELMVELENKKECVARLRPMVAEATQIHDACGKQLRDLKRNRKETVEKLKMNNQMKEMYSDLDELKKDTATSKMLGAVMDGSNDLQKEVDGARIVHENKTSTKIARAEQKAAQLKSDEYLESLKRKYNGGK